MSLKDIDVGVQVRLVDESVSFYLIGVNSDSALPELLETNQSHHITSIHS